MGSKFVLMAALAVWSAGAFAQGQADELKQLTQAVKALEAKVDSMRQELAALKKERKSGDDARLGRGVDLSMFRRIKLPQNPTDDQIKRYLDQLDAASSVQNSYTNADPQIRLYQDVGPDKLGLLLENLEWNQHGVSAYYLNAAIKNMVREQDKKLILDALPRVPSLVGVVIKHHWEQDAKRILLDKLAHNPGWLPAEWVQAVANLRDPQTYGLLKDYFIHGANHYGTFVAISKLPGLDLTDAVKEIWEKGDGGERNIMDGMDSIAFQYGHLDAMDSLLALMDNAKMPGIEGTIIPLFARHLEVGGDAKQLRAWLNQNRSKIYFDPKDKKYKVAAVAKP